MTDEVPAGRAGPVHVVGGGLAGSEAAWQLALAEVTVVLHEMRPKRGTQAHQTGQLAELVCSNSLRSDDWASNAVGLLHEEMRRCRSLIMATADAHKVPAGSALAVDREGFADAVTAALDDHPLVTVDRSEVSGLPPATWDNVIIATGPLTSPALSAAIGRITGEQGLAFFDAIAPIVTRDSIDFDIAWFQSRYDKQGPGGTGKDYINCPMSEDEYDRFLDALLAADTVPFQEWERDTPYFEGCLPLEVMAVRGRDTPRYGPMKPVGLTDPRTGRRPHAVVQLRQDNALGTLYNIVGFQTKLRHGAQKDVFRLIPGLEGAEFARLGGIHRNTFINSPRLLDRQLRLQVDPRLRFAGQITGVEGYVESAAIGLIAGRLAAADAKLNPANSLGTTPPETTALGALIGHITGGAEAATFQPMNINFGLLPPLEPPSEPPSEPRAAGPSGKRPKKLRARERKRALAERALDDLDAWLAGAGKQLAAAQ